MSNHFSDYLWILVVAVPPIIRFVIEILKTPEQKMQDQNEEEQAVEQKKAVKQPTLTEQANGCFIFFLIIFIAFFIAFYIVCAGSGGFKWG